MIAVIRIAGQVHVDGKQNLVLDNLRLRQKYACILINDRNILEKIKDKIAYGEISEETLKMLIAARGRKAGDKPIQEGIDTIIAKLKDGKTLNDLGIKPFFRLHPPKGGFKKSTKVLCPRGILGDHKQIDALLRRML